MLLGVVSVYNVFNHYQALADLSKSFHWLAAWWHYFVSLPFQWLHLHLQPVQRDLITLLLFFTSAASLALSRYTKRPARVVWAEIFKTSFDTLDMFQKKEPRDLTILGRVSRAFVQAIIMMFLSVAAILAITGFTPWFKIVGIVIMAHVLSVLVIALVFNYVCNKYLNERQFEVAMDILKIYLLPIAFWKAWMGTLTTFYREIFLILRLLLLILILDVVAKVAIDPFLRAHPTLPEPPRAGDIGDK